MEIVTLTHPEGGRVRVYPYGAHAAAWTDPAGQEILFLSRRSRFEPGAAIRGGVPVVFPQFADRGPLPKHGFARVVPWEPVGESADTVTLRLADTLETRALWPHNFRAELRISLDRALTLTLRVLNTGDAPLEFTAALHTYLRVGDVRRATLEGLRGTRYLDKVEGGEPRMEEHAALTVAGEVDRVYLDAPARLRLRDEALGRVVEVEQEGFPDTVVWNPWVEKARALEDLADEEYLEMLCVEAAAVGAPVRLEPGEEWSGTQRLRPPDPRPSRQGSRTNSLTEAPAGV